MGGNAGRRAGLMQGSCAGGVNDAAARAGGAAGEREPGAEGGGGGAVGAGAGGELLLCALAAATDGLELCSDPQLQAVVEEKATLERNISSLYNTAKLEIDRKAREIQELREQLAKAQR